MRNAISHVAMIGLALGFVGPALAIEPQSINWSKIPTKEIRLFYPGLSTYDWLLSPAHAGAKMVGQGQACLTCHKGSEKTRGEKIVKGGDLEPAPIPGKNGYDRGEGTGRARCRIRVFPLSMEITSETRRTYARLCALRREAMEMVRARP